MICESCGNKTTKKEIWGIAICRNCTKKYREATQKAARDLINKYEKEFEKLRDKYIDIIFKEDKAREKRK